MSRNAPKFQRREGRSLSPGEARAVVALISTGILRPTARKISSRKAYAQAIRCNRRISPFAKRFSGVWARCIIGLGPMRRGSKWPSTIFIACWRLITAAANDSNFR